jgi:hypothetical protein
VDLDDPNLDPDDKILVLFYIFYVVLPEIFKNMPKICLQSRRAACSWLVRELQMNECQISKPQIKMTINYRRNK